jgi:hypothetical protein
MSLGVRVWVTGCVVKKPLTAKGAKGRKGRKGKQQERHLDFADFLSGLCVVLGELCGQELFAAVHRPRPTVLELPRGDLFRH